MMRRLNRWSAWVRITGGSRKRSSGRPCAGGQRMAVPGPPRPSCSGRPVTAARSPLTITFRPKAILKDRCAQYVSVKHRPAAGGTHGLPEPARPATGIVDGSPRTSGCRRCQRTAATGRQEATPLRQTAGRLYAIG